MKPITTAFPPGLDARAASRLLARADPAFAPLVARAGLCPLKPERGFDPFGALASAIAHQQLTGKAAATILGRFVAQVGEGRFPDPEAVRRAPLPLLRGVGFSTNKSLALKDLAEKTLDGTVPKAAALRRMGDEEIVERLTRVRGVGRWTVEMVLMFRLGRLDVLPVDDYGVRKGFTLLRRKRTLVDPRALRVQGAAWAPYRSVAAWYLWRALEA